MAQLFAGVAKANITPYVGVHLAGFAARDHGCEGVHDELFARALVLRADETAAALVACDLIGLRVQSVARIRRHVEAATDVAADHVMVACTHTHSGPTLGCLRHPGLDLELVHVTERTIAGAVVQAWRSLGEAALGSGLGHAAIGINRRERRPDGSTGLGQNPGGPVDRGVAVLRLDGPEGRPAAVVVTHACHPVVLGGGNYLVSADYPGQTAAFLERACPGAVCGFLQGACGDINPVPVGGTFEDARRLGTILGAEALKVAASIETRADLPLAVARRTVQAPLAPLPPADELRELVARRSEELDAQLASGATTREQVDVDGQLAWARDALAEHDKPRLETTRPLELLAMRLGELLLIGTPGETFVEIGAAVRAASPLPHTVVVGYANGNVGWGHRAFRRCRGEALPRPRATRASPLRAGSSSLTGTVDQQACGPPSSWPASWAQARNRCESPREGLRKSLTPDSGVPAESPLVLDLGLDLVLDSLLPRVSDTAEDRGRGRDRDRGRRKRSGGPSGRVCIPAHATCHAPKGRPTRGGRRCSGAGGGRSADEGLRVQVCTPCQLRKPRLTVQRRAVEYEIGGGSRPPARM